MSSHASHASLSPSELFDVNTAAARQNPQGWVVQESFTVCRTPQDRITVTVESHSEVKIAQSRSAQLQRFGLDSAQLDSRSFAQALLGQLREHLSARDLEALVIELQRQMLLRREETHEVLDALDQLYS